MSMNVWHDSAFVREVVLGLDPADGIVAERWRRFVAWRLGGDGAALADGYECYVPVECVAFPLEAAATSPFMDA